jgi:hypothetical protein
MGIPKLPTYTFPNNNAKLMTILSVAAQAQEIAAIIAPFVNRPVSWRNVSDAAFRSVNLLESNGLISNEMSTALSDSMMTLRFASEEGQKEYEKEFMADCLQNPDKYLFSNDV